MQTMCAAPSSTQCAQSAPFKECMCAHRVHASNAARHTCTPCISSNPPQTMLAPDAVDASSSTLHPLHHAAILHLHATQDAVYVEKECATGPGSLNPQLLQVPGLLPLAIGEADLRLQLQGHHVLDGGPRVLRQRHARPHIWPCGGWYSVVGKHPRGRDLV